jgi:hypothetical protein
MRHRLEIENIQHLRWSQGIDDAELRSEIRGLRVGDCVKLTFQTATKSFAGQTLLVRITSISGCAFRGKLAESPAFVGLSKLRVGSAVRFLPAHIHSVLKRQLKHEQ